MSLRYQNYLWCEPCKRSTAHTAKGACCVCRAERRRAVRKAKSSSQGAPLARYADLLRIADELWSVWVRADRGACEMCLAPLPPERLQNAHGYSRQDRAIRFDPDNTFALCASCHRRHTPSRAEWYEWMRQRLGAARFDRLSLITRAGRKLSLSDLHLVILDAGARIEGLPFGSRKEWALERAAKIGERLVRLGVSAA